MIFIQHWLLFSIRISIALANAVYQKLKLTTATEQKNKRDTLPEGLLSSAARFGTRTRPVPLQSSPKSRCFSVTLRRPTFTRTLINSGRRHIRAVQKSAARRMRTSRPVTSLSAGRRYRKTCPAELYVRYRRK